MSIRLSGSVGRNGANHAHDVRKVQQSLNRVPARWGGPNVPLVEDGICGEKTKTAILDFQSIQLDRVINVDGRIDVNGQTLRRLNHINDSSERPGPDFTTSVEPIDHVLQPTNMVCWTAAGTMLCGARDQSSYQIETIMRRADTNDPGYGYLNMYQTNQGLPPQDTGRYTRAIGLRVAPPMSFTVIGWRQMMQRYGALGVVALTPFLHIRVVTEIYGDGSVFGTWFNVHDPGEYDPYTEVFINFANKYESAANINHNMDQIWHR